MTTWALITSIWLILAFGTSLGYWSLPRLLQPVIDPTWWYLLFINSPRYRYAIGAWCQIILFTFITLGVFNDTIHPSTQKGITSILAFTTILLASIIWFIQHAYTQNPYLIPVFMIFIGILALLSLDYTPSSPRSPLQQSEDQ